MKKLIAVTLLTFTIFSSQIWAKEICVRLPQNSDEKLQTINSYISRGWHVKCSIVVDAEWNIVFIVFTDKE